MTDLTATCVLDARAGLGESPVWSSAEQKLYWIDINAPALHRFDPATGANETWVMDESIGCIALDKAGRVIAALRSGVYRIDPGIGTRTKLADAPYDQAITRFNDGRCDRQGRFWAGGLHEPRDEPAARLYRLEGSRLQAQNAVAGVTISNGLAWSPDSRVMYHADTPQNLVWAYDFDPTSAVLSNRRVFLDLVATQERPDGAAVDSAGNYWLALYGSGRVVQFSGKGERLREVIVPTKGTTMPCFGGPDLRTLYITTARQRHTPEELLATPQAGGLFACRVDVAGLPEPLFAA